MLRAWLARLCIRELGVLGDKLDRVEHDLIDLADAHSTLVDRVNRFQNRVGMRHVRQQRTDQDDLAQMLDKARHALPGRNPDFPDL
jgi:hypothetical protein